MAPAGVDDPKRTLRWASIWLAVLGAMLATAGAVVAFRVIYGSGASTPLWRTVRAVAALLGWLVPGMLYLLFAYCIPHRKRWAVTGADVISYIQMLFAGVLVVVALLNVRELWPLLVASVAWVVPLVITPMIMSRCPKAITLLVQLPTLHLQETRREARRTR